MKTRFDRNVSPVTEVPCQLWTGALDRNGYGVISGPRDTEGHKRQWRTHVYAWTIAHGPVPAGMMVCHHCDVRCCVNADGCLFLGTNADNMADMARKGRASKSVGSRVRPGEGHPRAKLTDDNVREIRALHRSGTIRRADVAEMFSVSVGTVKQIWAGTRWRHLL